MLPQIESFDEEDYEEMLAQMDDNELAELANEIDSELNALA